MLLFFYFFLLLLMVDDLLNLNFLSPKMPLDEKQKQTKHTLSKEQVTQKGRL